MKKIILLSISIILFSCNSENEKNLKKSIWKFCGDAGNFRDVIDFRKDYFSVKNGSIYINWHQKDSLIGTIDKIEYYYGERRLYVKDLSGNIGRYCEQ